MPVYPKGPSKWLVRLYSDGKPRSWIVNGTKSEALDVEAARRLELQEQREAAGRTGRAPTFSSFCLNKYKGYARKHLKHSTWSHVRKYQVATLLEFFGDVRLDAFTSALIEDYKEWRLGAGTGNAAVNDELKAFRAILGYAQYLEVPHRIPEIRRLPPPPKRRVTVWTARQVADLYRATREHSPELLDIVTFLANTGCRKGEALALRWSNVDQRRRLIEIHPSDEWQPKSNRPREIPISDALVPMLIGPGRDGPVFPSSRGQRYAYWPQRAFDRARRAAGLKGGPHTLRHTFASLFLLARPDLFLLAQILGHSHTKVTEMYAHLLPDHLERARNAVSLVPDSGDDPDTDES